MKTIKKQCECGSCNVEIMSCTEIEEKVVEIAFICNDCGNWEKEKHYLYKVNS